MTNQEKIEELKTCISDGLTPIINSDYLYLELPYYSNVGDVLIWEGTNNFLRTLPYKCLYKASRQTFKYRKTSLSSIILLQGGGNFGDIWRKNQDFRLTIIKLYPNNKIIILPQTVYYEDNKVLEDDAKLISKHKNLIICARDTKSYEILTENFSNKILLLPDMAFFINMNKWKNYIKPSTCRILFLDRKDKEKKGNQVQITLPLEVETKDWPTMEKEPQVTIFLHKFLSLCFKIDSLFSTSFYNAFTDFTYQVFAKKYYIKIGVSFLSKYKYIYTTRLHVGILSILLKKEFTFLDNSYGKNKYFYETWLKDLESVKFK